MRTQIKNGNHGAIVSHNGDAFFTMIFVNCRVTFEGATVIRSKSHPTKAKALTWARKQIDLPEPAARANAPVRAAPTEAEAAMDRDMAEAAALLPTGLTIERCRHESVTETALWIFGPEGKQIGSVSFHREGWKANRMMNGVPTSQRFEKTLPLAVTFVTA